MVDSAILVACTHTRPKGGCLAPRTNAKAQQPAHAGEALRLEQHKSRGRSAAADGSARPRAFWPTDETVCIPSASPLLHGCRSGTFFWQPGKHLAEALENGSCHLYWAWTPPVGYAAGDTPCCSSWVYGSPK